METRRLRIQGLIKYVGPIATLAVTPFFSFDPINPIKVMVITSISGAVLYLMSVDGRENLRRIGGVTFVVSVLFFTGLIVPILFSGSNIQNQFWGDFGRNNGFLSYFALLLIFLGAVIVADEDFAQTVLKSFLVTAVLFSVYCLVQVLMLDPIPWSFYAPFGTLGNVNFSSAFLGMATVATFAAALLLVRAIWQKVLTLLVAAVQFFCVWKTESSQGLLIIGIGLALMSSFFIYLKNWRTLFLSVPLGLLFFFGLIQAFFNKGFLARVVYQETLTFRGDYMYAGLQMFLHRPLTGVGLDSFGDWYRKYRGVLSTYRTGFGRTSNSAHSLPIDLAATGGIFLVIPYLIMVFSVLLMGILYLKRTKKLFNPSILMIFTLWICYQAQALISINQIGLGIWGFIFSGVLVGIFSHEHGLLIFKNDQDLRKPRQIKKMGRRELNAKDAILTFLTFSIFSVLAIIPMQKDAQFRSAYNRGDITEVKRMSKDGGMYDFFLSQSFAQTLNRGDYESAKYFALKMTERNPNNVGGWQALRILPNTTPSENQLAISKIATLDPNFPCLNSDSRSFILEKILKMHPAEQFELVSFWKLPNMNLEKYNPKEFSISTLPEDVLNRRLDSYCSS